MKRKITKALNALPKTPDAISAELYRRGHVGRRESSCHCPMANYLTAEVGRSVNVHDGYLVWSAGRDQCDQVLRIREDWPALVEFIELFDQGEWPNLVMREAL